MYVGPEPPAGERIRVNVFMGSHIEAKLGNDSVVIDNETGETVTSTVPVGSPLWRRLARCARNYRS